MRIYIDAGSLRLLQKHFHIAQIMSRNKNARITSDTDINRSNLRISISLGVCSIQKRHSPDTIFASFQRQVNQIIHTQTVIQRRRKRPL